MISFVLEDGSWKLDPDQVDPGGGQISQTEDDKAVPVSAERVELHRDLIEVFDIAAKRLPDDVVVVKVEQMRSALALNYVDPARGRGERFPHNAIGDVQICGDEKQRQEKIE